MTDKYEQLSDSAKNQVKDAAKGLSILFNLDKQAKQEPILTHHQDKNIGARHLLMNQNDNNG